MVFVPADDVPAKLELFRFPRLVLFSNFSGLTFKAEVSELEKVADVELVVEENIEVPGLITEDVTGTLVVAALMEGAATLKAPVWLSELLAAKTEDDDKTGFGEKFPLLKLLEGTANKEVVVVEVDATEGASNLPLIPALSELSSIGSRGQVSVGPEARLVGLQKLSSFDPVKAKLDPLISVPYVFFNLPAWRSSLVEKPVYFTLVLTPLGACSSVLLLKNPGGVLISGKTKPLFLDSSSLETNLLLTRGISCFPFPSDKDLDAGTFDPISSSSSR
nr:hypothetical protein Iba_chr02bCG21910 [Ipomoea batatas]